MNCWMTESGAYYEADTKLNDRDFRVPRRPSKDAVYDGSEWMIQDRCIPAPIYSAHLPPPPVVHQPEKQDQGGTLSKDTKLTFGIKDIIIVGSFVVSATVAWQDINQRINKLETDKTVEQLASSLRSLEAEVKAIDRVNKSDLGRLEKSINEVAGDLERYIIQNGQHKREK